MKGNEIAALDEIILAAAEKCSVITNDFRDKAEKHSKTVRSLLADEEIIRSKDIFIGKDTPGLTAVAAFSPVDNHFYLCVEDSFDHEGQISTHPESQRLTEAGKEMRAECLDLFIEIVTELEARAFNKVTHYEQLLGGGLL